MDAPETTAIIVRNLEMAREIGIEGTPTIIFEDILVSDVVDLEIMQAYVSAKRILLSDTSIPELSDIISLGEDLSEFTTGSLWVPTYPLRDIAKNLLEKAVRLYQSRSEAYVALAAFYDEDAAIAHLDKAIELDPENSDAYFERALRTGRPGARNF